jgi:hypothetical protein
VVESGNKTNKPNKKGQKPMNAIVTRKYEMLQSISSFEDDYPIVPANARATVLFATVDTVIADIEAAIANQTQGFEGLRGGAAVRKEIALALRSAMKEIGRTARSLNRGSYPGIAEQFRLPKSRAYGALLGSAQAMITVATPIKQAFIDQAMPAEFLDDLEELVAAFASATSQKNDGSLMMVGGTAAHFLRAAAGVAAARELDAIVRNHFRNNPTVLAIWTAARRIERAPVRSAASEPAPVPGPGSGS